MDATGAPQADGLKKFDKGCCDGRLALEGGGSELTLAGLDVSGNSGRSGKVGRELESCYYVCMY